MVSGSERLQGKIIHSAYNTYKVISGREISSTVSFSAFSAFCCSNYYCEQEIFSFEVVNCKTLLPNGMKLLGVYILQPQATAGIFFFFFFCSNDLHSIFIYVKTESLLHFRS